MRPSEPIQARAVQVLAGLPAPLKRLIAGRPVRRDGLVLDLDAQLVVRAERLSPRPPVEQRGAERGRDDLRASSRMVAGRCAPLRSVRPLRLAGLGARLYEPHDATGALLVFFHGGGWVVGDLDTHDAPCRALAHAAGITVLSVDYRCAPEHCFPAPVDDAVAAFREAATRCDELGVDPQRIAVGGDSAGGHLAAMVALRCCEDDIAPAFQLLIYPATDLAETYPSARTFAEGFLLTKANMDWYEAQFVPDPAAKEEASPLRAADLSGACPALVVTAGFDPLRDEGEAYAEALREAGVKTILRRHPGQVHGFFNMTAFASAREAISETAGVLRASV